MVMPVCLSVCLLAFFSFQCHSTLTRGGRERGKRTSLINWYRKLQATTWIACPICSSLERSDLNHWWDLIELYEHSVLRPRRDAHHGDHQENSAHDPRAGGGVVDDEAIQHVSGQVPYLSWRPRTSRRGDRALSSQTHPFKSGWLDIILWVKKLL